MHLQQPISASPTLEAPSATHFTGSLFGASADARLKAQHWKRHFLARVFPYALFAIDLILIALIYSAAVQLRYEGVAVENLSRRILAVLAGVGVLSIFFVGGYDYYQDMRRFRFICEHAIASIFGALLVLVLVYGIISYGENLHSARSTVLFTLAIFPLVSIAYRIRLGWIKDRLRAGNAICIVGVGDEARDLFRRLRAQGIAQSIFVADEREENIGRHLNRDDMSSPTIRRLGDVRLDSSIDGKFIESYIVARPVTTLPQDFIKSLAIAQFHGNRVFTYESFLGEVLRIVPPSKMTIAWAFSEGFRLNRRLTYDRVKRLSDLLMATLGLIVLGPLIALVALAVRLTSPGPVIFKQVRVGEREKPFWIYKFRSMRLRSESGSEYTRASDPRFTPIGAFIRKTRLDELPQLWNVLKGDISMIGPRAEWVDLVKKYEAKFPFYHFRHAVKPGISGWAQVNYPYGENDADTMEKLNYDLYYVRHYSFFLDLTIVFKTIYTILFARGR